MAALGDAIMASPALRLLRDRLPDWRIAVLAKTQCIEYFSSLSSVDLVIPFVNQRHVHRGKPWRLLQSPSEVVQLLHALRSEHFSASLQWRGQLCDTLLSRWTNAQHRVATVQSFHRRSIVPVENVSFLITDLVRVENPNAHMVDAMTAPAVRLLELLGKSTESAHRLSLEYPLSPADQEKAHAFLSSRGITSDENFAVVAFSAKTSVNSWQLDRFAAVADHLQQHCGLKIILSGLPEQIDLEGAIARQMKTPAVRSTAQVGLGPLCAILKRSRVLISLNTGISHAAAALQVPVVVLSGRDGAAITPYRSPHRIVTRNVHYPARHPDHREWPKLVNRIEVPDVIAAAEDLLNTYVARR